MVGARTTAVDSTLRSAGPWSLETVHPSWWTDLVPSDPVIGGWCQLMLLSEGADPDLIREQIVSSAGRSGFFLATTPPPWIGRWWRSRVEGRLGRPLALPQADAGAPFAWWWTLSAKDAETVATWSGGRLLALLLQSGEARARLAAEVVLALPQDLQRQVMLWAREGSREGTSEQGMARDTAKGVAERWGRALSALHSTLHSELAARLLPLALGLLEAAVAADVPGVGSRAGAQRLALRLPRDLASCLVYALEARCSNARDMGVDTGGESLPDRHPECPDWLPAVSRGPRPSMASRESVLAAVEACADLDRAPAELWQARARQLRHDLGLLVSAGLSSPPNLALLGGAGAANERLATASTVGPAVVSAVGSPIEAGVA